MKGIISMNRSLRLVRFTALYSLITLAPAFTFTAIFTALFYGVLWKGCFELACLAILIYFVILTPIVIFFSVVSSYHIGKRIAQKIVKNSEELVSFAKFSRRVTIAVIALFSALPLLLIFSYFFLENFASNLFDYESSSYKNAITIDSMKDALTPISRENPNPKLTFSATANVKRSDTYHFNEPKLWCDAMIHEGVFTLNGQNFGPNIIAGKPYLGNLLKLDLVEGKTPFTLEYTLTKSDFYNELYQSTQCILQYEIFKLGRIKKEGIESRLGLKEDYYEDWEFDVTNEPFGNEYRTRNYQKSEFFGK